MIMNRATSKLCVPARQAAAPLRLSSSSTRQSVRMMAAGTPASSSNVIDIIKEEHRHVEKLYAIYKTSSDQEKKQNAAWHIIRELSTHAAKEEMVLYPAVREKMGDEIVEHALAEHQELKHTLSDLDAMDISNPEFDAKLTKAMEEVAHHVHQEEEPKMLAKFAKAEGVTTEYLNKLGEEFKDAEARAPSRPHPLAPNKFPVNVAANATAVPLDMGRDLARFGTATPNSVEFVKSK